MLSPIDTLNLDLKAKFPDAKIEIRKADDPKGFQFLNLRLHDLEIAVEWKQDEGFGISSFSANSNELEGLFGPPDAWHRLPQEALDRIVVLVLKAQATNGVPYHQA